MKKYDLSEKAILVGVNINNRDDFELSMQELFSLAEACNLKVVGRIDQNLRSVQPQYYVGTGKVDEIRLEIECHDADVVIINHEITPSQLRNLERALQIKVLDRTQLILEIFEQRARTREAKLQVEAAQLKYLLPRLIGSYDALGRQSGGVGTYNKGVGEKKLELDRRRVEHKIVELNRELDALSLERQTQRNKRMTSSLPSIALVGYTNAGKSTLLNAMVECYSKNESKKVFEKDMLFATLETSVRQIRLPDRKVFTLSDTVGFVSELPHDLIKAFRATLDEVKEADLLLHVIDYSNPNYKNQMQVTLDTLKEIGAEHVPLLNVYNKTEKTKHVFPEITGESVYISAKNRIGIEELVSCIKARAFKDYVECMMKVPYDEGKFLAYLNENAMILSSTYEEEWALIKLECHKMDFEQFHQYVVES